MKIMEKEINIAEILRNKLKGTKLYSPVCGKVVFDKIERDLGHDTIFVTTPAQTHYTFMEDGKYERNGECLLFPSKKLRDWTKFAWKKGDVLQSDDGKVQLIFDGFIGESYKTFCAKHELTINSEEKSKTYEYETNRFTDGFSKVEDELAKAFIKYIGEKLGGKLNLETLEIEPAKPKWTPKPFDKIIVRGDSNDTWVASLFSHMKEGRYVAINCCEGWDECLPYNEETAKLIGTTKSLEDLK